MCGIAGAIGISIPEAIIRQRMLRAMTVLSPRGPDQQAIISGTGFCVGSTRLQIRHGELGRQPAQIGNIVVQLNGELYNDDRMCPENAQIVSPEMYAIARDFQSSRELGNRLRHWDGMFAAAAYCIHTQVLVLARDRFGEKPLYWIQQDDGIYYASTTKALIALIGRRPELSKQGLAETFLTGSAASPNTCLKDIQQLPPGTALRWHCGGIELVAFGELTVEHDRSTLSLDDQIDWAVDTRTPNSGPIGLSLSGGIDSAIILRSLRRNGVDPKRILGVCVATGDGSWDESTYAQLVAKRYDISLDIVRLDTPSAVSMLPNVLQELQDPIVDPSLIPTWALAAHFNQNRIRVVLGGDGADEMFAGYPSFLAHPFTSKYEIGKLPLDYFSTIRAFVYRHWPYSSRYWSTSERLRRIVASLGLPMAWQHFGWFGPMPLCQYRWLMHGDPFPIDAPFAQSNKPRIQNDTQTLKQLQEFYLGNYLPSVLAKLDAAMAAQGVESRSPFLHAGLAQIALHLPTHQKVRHLRGKHSLRSLLARDGLLSIANRPKHGFAPPLQHWLRDPRADSLLHMTSDFKSAACSLFDVERLNALLKRQQIGQGNFAKELWAVTVIEHWYKNLQH